MRKPCKPLMTLFLLLASLGGTTVAHSIEEPRFELVDRIGKVEIRRYEPVVQAVTVMDSNAQTSRGFRRLAGYIFGDNASGQNIAMTAPVQETLGVPRPEMAFTMPAQYDYEALPEPNNPRIELRQVPARTRAVIAFGGWATPGRVARMEATLKRLLAEQDIEMTGELALNQYNPPWTLPFLRRNEIVVDVAWEVAHGRVAHGSARPGEDALALSR